MFSDSVVSILRLGLLYAIYRGVVAAILCAVYAFDFLSLHDQYISVYWYSWILLAYTVLTILQLLCFVVYRNRINQIIWMGAVDVFCLGVIQYAIGHASMHVGLLFIVTVFVLNLVQNKRISTLLTLGAMISVVYLPFIDGFFKPVVNETILGSVLITIMFFVVSVLAKFTVGRYQKLQEISQINTDQLKQLRDVAYNIMLDVDTGYLVLNCKTQIVFINKVAQTALGGKADGVEYLSELNFNFYQQYVSGRLNDNGIDRFSCTLFGVEYHISIQKTNPTQDLYLLTFESSNKVNEKLHKLKLAALGQISASIAHEIRNPLATIYQAVGLINGASEDKLPRYCGMIKKQCDRIDVIIQSTLDMAKNKGLQVMECSVKAFILNLLAEDLMDVRSKIKLIGGDDELIMFDEGHFRQVLTNLIRNAVRHNNYEVSEVIEIRMSSNLTDLVIDIADFGDGVSPNNVNKLFVPFFSTEKTGTGLGLYLVKNLCESNQAKIELIESSIGACFRITCIKVR